MTKWILQSSFLTAIAALYFLLEIQAASAQMNMDMSSGSGMQNSSSVTIGAFMMNMAPMSAAYDIPNNLFGQSASTIAEKILEAKSMSNMTTYDSCKRPCTSNGRPRLCYNEFQIENFHAMGPVCGNCSQGVLADCLTSQCITGDGIEMGVTSINRIIPGPHLEVCEGDIVLVRVMNMMMGQETTIHWHGVLQKGTQYMDGVPMVTQCPIQSGAMFRYTFWANNSGTHFFHSHSGEQRLSGIVGSLTVRDDPANDPNSKLYDYDDHHILITDWIHVAPETFIPGLPTRLPGIGIPQSLLFNGRGRVISEFTGLETLVPYETFFVNSGKRYRFRVVDGASSVCPTRLQIEGHTMQLIASDGISFEPLTVDSLMIYPGERYDFVLNANKPNGNYWMHLLAVGACDGGGISQVAVLAYNQNPAMYGMLLPTSPRPTSLGYPEGIILNQPNSTCSANSTRICVHRLRAYQRDSSVTQEVPDTSFFIRPGEFDLTNSLVYSDTRINFLDISGDDLRLAAIDQITTLMPASPYLSQPMDINQTTLCNISSLPAECVGKTYCACNHYRTLELNKTVQIILFDDMAISQVNHPFHLHGTGFYVMRVGQDSTEMVNALGNDMKSSCKCMTKSKNCSCKHCKRKNQIAANFVRNPAPPVKDTISIPSGGYAVIRFRASNPGVWMMHCHFDDHMNAGMSLVFRIGELSDVPPVPKNFPTCGNFD